MINKPYLSLHIKFTNFHYLNELINKLLVIINNIPYELYKYNNYENEYNAIITISNIDIFNEIESLLDITLDYYNFNNFKYNFEKYINKYPSTIRINKTGKKIYTKKQTKNIGF